MREGDYRPVDHYRCVRCTALQPSLIPRPSHFDCLQRAGTDGEGLGAFIMRVSSVSTCNVDVGRQKGEGALCGPLTPSVRGPPHPLCLGHLTPD